MIEIIIAIFVIIVLYLYFKKQKQIFLTNNEAFDNIVVTKCDDHY
jgi:hypothetical protein